MKILIIAFGAVIVVMAAILVVRPRAFTTYMLKHAGETWMHFAAAGFRLALGIVLLLYAAQSRFPLVFQIFGWVALIAGTVLLFVPPAKFSRLVQWAFDRFGRFIPAAGALAVLFGAFLIYAVT